MKNLVVGVILLLIVGVGLFLGGRYRSRALRRPDRKDVYLGLRNIPLHTSREEFHLPPTSAPTEPWGAVMDWGVDAGTATVVAFSDGHASVYLSSGGGLLGGGESHDAIRSAAKQMVAAAVECQPQTHATSDFPLPRNGEVFFYLLTDAGVFTASASEKDMATHRHPLSKLGDAAQNVITQYRLIQQGK